MQDSLVARARLQPCWSGSVPTELIKMIIDEIAEEKSTLRSCALVCRAWTPIAHMHIFHSLHITVHIDCWKSPLLFFAPSIHVSKNVGALNRLLRSSPHISSYVKRLTITTSYDHWFYCSIPATLADIVNTKLGHFWNYFLPCFLRSLDRVEELILPQNLRHPLSENVPKRVIDGLGCVLRSTSLTSFAMLSGSSNDLYAMLGQCRALRDLHVGDITFHDETPNPSSFPPLPLKLQFLAITSRMDAYMRFVNKSPRGIVDFSHLKRLEIIIRGSFFAMEADLVPTTEDLIRRNKETLRDLVLNVCPEEYLFNLVDPARIRNLHITMASSPRPASQNLEAWVRWLTRSFSGMKSISLERCLFQLNESNTSADVMALYDEWRKLDTIMSSRPGLPGLNVRLWRSGSLTSKDVEDIFPSLSATGRLHVRVADVGF
ncbi:uncharacterized protein EV420DRAFT_1575756 [Desarmillaria tabescens]|uniref:F-box domain-containing protein n=1 Tax=Armillaria tabescens TaxID=1929756 RepID=A0AA39JK59_ARMTA|nr:uncharacterized protein EV420DRAFT_1575756 [Desarmillaria tabescens]KAK0443969.1 hypothetical protein EV420DRAFT_1575756 [Desarmillaria tabescens]